MALPPVSLSPLTLSRFPPGPAQNSAPSACIHPHHTHSSRIGMRQVWLERDDVSNFVEDPEGLRHNFLVGLIKLHIAECQSTDIGLQSLSLHNVQLSTL